MEFYGNERELIAIRTSITAIKHNMGLLLDGNGLGDETHDEELWKMYNQLETMTRQLSRKIREVRRAAEINLEDHVPGAVIEPKDIPEQDLDDFDI